MGKYVMHKASPLMRILEYVSILGALYCLLTPNNRFEFPLWLLPVCYSCLLILCRNNLAAVKSNIGAMILNITMFGRYLLLPVIMYSTGDLSRFSKDYSYLHQALWLMLYEMVMVFLTLELSGNHYIKKQLRVDQYNHQVETDYFHINGGWIIASIVLIALLGIGVVYKDLSAGFSVITTGVLNRNEMLANNNALNIVWQVLCVWLYMYGIIRQKEKSHVGNEARATTVVTIYTILFVLMTFIETIGFSRWYTVISGCASFACISKLFPNAKRKFVFSILIPGALLILLITTYKNAGYVIGNTTFIDSIFKVFSSSNFDSYFAGIVNVNNSIGLKRTGNFTVVTVFLDLLNNMPIVNHLIDITRTSVYQYNGYVGRLFGGTGDQIIPLIGQSSIYFSYVFAPLLSCLSVLLVRRADYRFNKTNSYMQYIYGFEAAWYAVIPMMLNITIMINWVYIRVLPFAVALFITDRFAMKAGVKRNEDQDVNIYRNNSGGGY